MQRRLSKAAKVVLMWTSHLLTFTWESPGKTKKEKKKKSKTQRKQNNNKKRRAYFCWRVLMWQTGRHLQHAAVTMGLSADTPEWQLVQNKAIVSACSLGIFSISPWKRNTQETWPQTCPGLHLQDLPGRAETVVQSGWFCHLVAFSTRFLQVCVILVSAKQQKVLW